MSNIWTEASHIDVPAALIDAVGGHAIVARLLVQRGVTEPDEARAFLDARTYRPAPPTDLPDVDVAVERLRAARAAGTRVCVWGDFDADGQSSTAVLVGGLRDLGFDVTYHVPRRDRDGHGLNESGLRHVIDEGGAGLILTCDCGVGDADAVAVAQRHGAEVLITDHHELAETLPNAAAIINPHRLPGEDHPLRHLCGVGTAFMLLRALYAADGRAEDADQWLDLVALGTIADLALLRDDNRYLVQRGLPKLLYRSRTGIRALLQTAGTAPSELLDTEVVSYTLAPRLNAVGRLDDARTAVELLLADDVRHAFDLATKLERYNDRRRRLCDEVEADVERRLRDRPELLEAPALVLAGTDWHPGVIGIVASRLVERYHKPAILLSSTVDGELRASARSVPGLHLHETISRHDDLLERAGGHEMAAGFVADPEQLSAFRDAFQATVAEVLPDNVSPELRIDAEVSLSDITPPFVRDVYRLAPFGPGNREPIFVCRDARLLNVAALGVDGNHSRLVVEDADGVKRPAVWWQTTPRDVPARGPVDVAFRVGLDEYGRFPTARLVVVATRARGGTRVLAEEPAAYAYTPDPYRIEDRRAAPDRDAYLDALLRDRGEDAVQVWAEGSPVPDLSVVGDRTALVSAADLVVWSLPPGPRELRSVLQRVAPRRVHLLTAEPESVSTTAFLQALAHVVKSLLGGAGETTLTALAARLGHRQETVRYGLDFLQARGAIVYEETDGRVRIRKGDGTPVGKDNQEMLTRLLQETAAYRRYFSRAEPEGVLRFRD